MNGRIERDGEIAWRTHGEPRAKPRMYRSRGEAARKLGAIVGLWACGGWFFSMMVRQREVGAWEIAGLLVGLVAVNVVAEEREAKEERDAE